MNFFQTQRRMESECVGLFGGSCNNSEARSKHVQLWRGGKEEKELGDRFRRQRACQRARLLPLSRNVMGVSLQASCLGIGSTCPGLSPPSQHRIFGTIPITPWLSSLSGKDFCSHSSPGRDRFAAWGSWVFITAPEQSIGLVLTDKNPALQGRWSPAHCSCV